MCVQKIGKFTGFLCYTGVQAISVETAVCGWDYIHKRRPIHGSGVDPQMEHNTLQCGC